MKTKLTLIFLVLTMVGIPLLPTTASAQTSVSQSENLLLNGGFEEGFTLWNDEENKRVANFWTPFFIEANLDLLQGVPGSPNYDVVTSANGRVYNGSQSQEWNNGIDSQTSAFAGVYQKVTVIPETTIRLKAFTYAWSSPTADFTQSKDAAWVRQRVGIDPTGGTDPSAASVVWSAPVQFIDKWGEIFVEADAVNNEVTVFLSAYPNTGNTNYRVFYDNASLIAVQIPLPKPSEVTVVVNAKQGTSVSCNEQLLAGLVTGCGGAPGALGYSGSMLIDRTLWLKQVKEFLVHLNW